MSLSEKVANYTQIMQEGDGYSSLGTEIIEDLKDLLKNIKDQNSPQDQREKIINELLQASHSFPDALFDNHSQELLEALLENTTEGIYKAFDDLKIDLKSTENIEIEVKSLNELILKMLKSYLQKVSVKETLLYLKAILEKKNKNLQQNFLFLELLCHIAQHINKKEAFFNELLPDVLRILNTLFYKYLKYKKRVDNEEYSEIPVQIPEFLKCFEPWIKNIIKKLLKSIIEIHNSHRVVSDNVSKTTQFLLVEDLYNESTQQSIGNTNTLDKKKLLNHYCVLFLLDLLSIILSNQVSGLSNDLSNEFISQIIDALLHFNPKLSTFLINYKSQLKVKESDPASSVHNNRDNNSLLLESYHALTFYNPISLCFLAIRFIENENESFLLTAEYKLKLIFPCINQLFNLPGPHIKLKEDMMACVNKILDAIISNTPANSLQNINKFDIPLDTFMEIILDYSGGPVDEKHRTLGLGIYNKFNKLLSEKARARLLLLIITKTKNYALSGHLISEFKSGINSALRVSGGGAEIRNAESSFLNLNYLRIFFEMGISLDSSKYKDDTDLTAACVNIIMLIYLKLSNLTKNVPDFMTLEFKDAFNIFNPKNLGLVLNYGEKVNELDKKIQGDLEIMNSQIEQLQKEEANHPNLGAAFKKFNDLLVINDSISRIQEIFRELNPLCSVDNN